MYIRKKMHSHRNMLAAVICIFLMIAMVPISSFADDQGTDDTVTFDSYRVYSSRVDVFGIPPNGDESVMGCSVVIEADFPGELSLNDSAAAASCLELAKGTSVMCTGYAEVSVQSNKLRIELETTYMPGGVLQFKNEVISGITCDGKTVVWPEGFKTVVPTGLQLAVTDVTVGTADTPASTTVQVMQSAVIRSMNHILWTSNGESIIPDESGTAQTTPAHHHNYWSFTTADSAAFIIQGANSIKGRGYILSQDGDKVTITAANPKEGEYLGIYNYDDDFLQSAGFSCNERVTGLPCLAADTENADINAVMGAINAIGIVDISSEQTIKNARDAFSALPEERQALVRNKIVLERAENALSAAIQRVNDVIAKIDAIGKVSLSSENSISSARTDYNKLSDAEKGYVTNYGLLTSAEADLQSLKAEAEKQRQEKEKAEAAKKKASAAKTTVKVKALKKKKIKVSWKKIKGVSGYYVYRSMKKKSGFKKVKTIKKASVATWTNTKLKAGKKYYYKIQPYTKLKGKTIKGKYSSVVSIKAKK